MSPSSSSSDPNTASANPATLLTWLRLIRVPNVFTAISNVTVGYVIADSGFNRLPVWLGCCVASACMYSAGMALNDYFDRDLDKVERPERPIPSGQISAGAAYKLGACLLLLGVVAAFVTGGIAKSQSPLPLQPGVIAVALAFAIVLYDRTTKGTVFGPLTMGLCRALNVMLGVSMTASADLWQVSTPWLVAGGIGLYVMGVTWFAWDEAVESRRSVLVGGVALMLLGVVTLIVFPSVADFPQELRKVVFAQPWVWPLLLCLLTASVWRRAIVAIQSTAAPKVQATIKQALMALLSIDAALTLLLAGPIVALGIIALMLPTFALGRVVRMT